MQAVKSDIGNAGHGCFILSEQFDRLSEMKSLKWRGVTHRKMPARTGKNLLRKPKIEYTLF